MVTFGVTTNNTITFRIIIDLVALGIGISKIVITNAIIDYNLKYKILQQTRSNSMPVNLTYFGCVTEDTRGGEYIKKYVHRFNFFLRSAEKMFTKQGDISAVGDVYR